MITREQAERLTIGTTIYHATLLNADHTPIRCRVNGKLKTWKTRPKEFRLPLKYSYRFGAELTHMNNDEWCLSESEANGKVFATLLDIKGSFYIIVTSRFTGNSVRTNLISKVKRIENEIKCYQGRDCVYTFEKDDELLSYREVPSTHIFTFVTDSHHVQVEIPKTHVKD